MDFEVEKAKIMLKLVRKGNWNNSYDRREHFKWFENLDDSIKELQKKEWVIIHKKPKFEAYSLNTNYKIEIIKFIEQNIPEVRGTIK